MGNLKSHLGLAGRHLYYLRALRPLGSMKYAQTAEIVDELRQEAALESIEKEQIETGKSS